MTLKKLNTNKKKSLKNRFFEGGYLSTNELSHIGSISYPVMRILKNDLMLSNYGSSYKTTGGGKIKNTHTFIQKGMNYLDHYVNNKVSYNNMVQDMGNYWLKKKKKDISKKDVHSILSQLFHSNYKQSNKHIFIKRGGSKILIPPGWLDNNTSSCPKNRQLSNQYSINNTFTNKKMSCLEGGSSNAWNQDSSGTKYRVDGDSTWFGTGIPPNTSQYIRDKMTGVSTLFKPPSSSITNLQSQNFCSTNNCYVTPSYGNIINPDIQVKNIDLQNNPGVVYSSELSNPPMGNTEYSMKIRNQRA